MTQIRDTLLRSKDTYEKYVNRVPDSKCFMCGSDNCVTIKSYKHWKIIENNYPYDNVAQVHHMLVPKRHIPFTHSFEKEEETELWLIKYMINKTTDYDCILENFAHGQSQPGHVHYHLLKWKPI